MREKVKYNPELIPFVEALLKEAEGVVGRPQDSSRD